MAKISVIGAGVGGMSAAARLAKQGHEVTIYENSDRSGGKCRTEWFGDYGFDTGPSLLTLPAVYRDLFLKTGKRIEHILDITPVDPAFNYHFADGTYGSRDGAGAPNQSARPYDRFNTYMGSPRNGDRFGLDNNQYEPFFTSIQISQMARHQYLTLTLVNPIIESWQHDTLENSVGADPVQNSMTVAYESVFYADGPIDEGNSPKGFGTVHYDNTPSPISAGSSSSLFGSAGILAGGTSVLGDIASGKADLGTLLTAARTVRNAKDLTKEGIRNEAFQVAGQTIRTATGTNVSGLANTSFPKSGGTGTQTTEAIPINTQKQNKLYPPVEVVQTLNDNPQLKETLAKKSLAIGAISTTTEISADLSTWDTLNTTEKNSLLAQVDSGIETGNQKIVQLANQIVNNFNETGQGNTSTVSAQKNPLGNT